VRPPPTVVGLGDVYCPPMPPRVLIPSLKICRGPAAPLTASDSVTGKFSTIKFYFCFRRSCRINCNSCGNIPCSVICGWGALIVYLRKEPTAKAGSRDSDERDSQIFFQWFSPSVTARRPRLPPSLSESCTNPAQNRRSLNERSRVT